MASPEPRPISATEFKERCLALLEQVARTRRPIIVTKHGKPIVKVISIAEQEHDMLHSVTLVAESPEAYLSTGERWDVDADESPPR